MVEGLCGLGGQLRHSAAGCHQTQHQGTVLKGQGKAKLLKPDQEEDLPSPLKQHLLTKLLTELTVQKCLRGLFQHCKAGPNMTTWR